jgi:hypothetical protein
MYIKNSFMMDELEHGCVDMDVPAVQRQVSMNDYMLGILLSADNAILRGTLIHDVRANKFVDWAPNQIDGMFEAIGTKMEVDFLQSLRNDNMDDAVNLFEHNSTNVIHGCIDSLQHGRFFMFCVTSINKRRCTSVTVTFTAEEYDRIFPIDGENWYIDHAMFVHPDLATRDMHLRKDRKWEMAVMGMLSAYLADSQRHQELCDYMEKFVPDAQENHVRISPVRGTTRDLCYQNGGQAYVHTFGAGNTPFRAIGVSFGSLGVLFAELVRPLAVSCGVGVFGTGAQGAKTSADAMTAKVTAPEFATLLGPSGELGPDGRTPIKWLTKVTKKASTGGREQNVSGVLCMCVARFESK